LLRPSSSQQQPSILFLSFSPCFPQVLLYLLLIGNGRL
jgi:hypothetical protein